MHFSIKKVLKLSTIACVITGAGFGADYGIDVYRQATAREVALESEPGYSSMNNGPISVLQSAVPKDRLAARFRIKWSEVNTGLFLEGWILYDRRRSILQVDSYGSFSGKGDETVHDESVYSYTSVTDEIITELSPSANVDDLPELLAQLGCHVQKIRDSRNITH
jgi:hypothetical protein